MSSSVIIVESPAKVKTLKKFLGKEYEVLASVGHVRDLPKKTLGVDVDKGFEPQYETIRGKKDALAKIRQTAKAAKAVFLATDPDREGEAIAWHVAEELGNGARKSPAIYRITFNEITKRAVTDALKTPGRIDMSLVDAQQARRVMDRLMGYQLSPLLWEKVRRGLSAGRVQSVAVRLVCEREREINEFKQEEFWSITAGLEAGAPPPFEAKLARLDGKKAALPDQAAAEAALRAIEGKPFLVASVERKEKRRNPVPPFITSTLQQEAARKLGFTAKKTMMLAQRLYEGVEIGSEGSVGLITYMRTDSFRIAKEAQDEARDAIRTRFGPEYIPSAPPVYASKKGAQDAHEAVRPTSPSRTPEVVKDFLERDMARLYRLIWERFIASQMPPALMDATAVEIEAGPGLFKATGSVITFPGFLKVYAEGRDDEEKKDSEEPEVQAEEREGVLPSMKPGDVLSLKSLAPRQHFTQPPPRYTEATLVKTLEEKGIGRPSTYAAILSTIQDRKYAEKIEKKFHPTPLGVLVNDLLVSHFPTILDVAFTARMEEELDRVEEGNLPWRQAVGDFYAPFSESLAQAKVEMRNVKTHEIPTDIACEKCGQKMVIRWGKNGEFLACSAYPDCKNTREFTRDAEGGVQPAAAPETGETCENCGSPMVHKRGRFGPFLACSRYPECKTTRPLGKGPEEPAAPPEPTGETCGKCGSPLVVRSGRFGRFIACARYPTCKTTKPISIGVACPEPDCGGYLTAKKTKRGRTFYSCSRYPDCKYAVWDRPVPTPCPACGAPFLVENRTKKNGTVLKCVREGCAHTQPVPEAGQTAS
jgi:DNA topoisomerase-1